MEKLGITSKQKELLKSQTTQLKAQIKLLLAIVKKLSVGRPGSSLWVRSFRASRRGYMDYYLQPVRITRSVRKKSVRITRLQCSRDCNMLQKIF